MVDGEGIEAVKNIDSARSRQQEHRLRVNMWCRTAGIRTYMQEGYKYDSFHNFVGEHVDEQMLIDYTNLV